MIPLNRSRSAKLVSALALFTILATIAGAPRKNRPSAPENCAAAGLWTFVVVSWTDTSNNEDGFYVEYRSASGNATWTVPANTASVTLTWAGPADGTFRVRAFNSAGNSSWSNRARVIMQ